MIPKPLFLAIVAFLSVSAAITSCSNQPANATVGSGASTSVANEVECYSQFNAIAQGIAGDSGDFPYPSPLPQPTASVTGIDDTQWTQTGGKASQANLLILDPCSQTSLLYLYQHGNSVNPTTSPAVNYAGLWNYATRTWTDAAVMSDLTSNANGHDSAMGIDKGGGYADIIGGALSIGNASVPTVWQNTSGGWGGSGPYPGAEEIRTGNGLGGCGSCWDNSANEYYAPLPGGLSEFSDIADSSPMEGQISLHCGQVQYNTTRSFAGNIGCFTTRLTAANALCFDIWTSTGSYLCAPDTTGTSGTVWGSESGEMEITAPPASSTYFYTTLSGTGNGSNETFNINGCVASIPTTSAETVASFLSAAVTYYLANCVTLNGFTNGYYYLSGASGTSPGTSSFITETTATGPAWNTLTTPPSSTCSGGGFTCAANTVTYLSSGDRHFLWEFGFFDPTYHVWVLAGDVQWQTTSGEKALNNDQGPAMYFFVSRGPDTNGNWTFGNDTNIDHAVTVHPNDAPLSTTNLLLGAGPGGSCSYSNPFTGCPEPSAPGGICWYCIEPPSSYPSNSQPFGYDWGSLAQYNLITSSGIPVISTEDAAPYKGQWYFVTENCANATGFCGDLILQIRPTDHTTTGSWFVPIGTASSFPADFFVVRNRLQENPYTGALTLYIDSGSSAFTTGLTAHVGYGQIKSTFNGTTWSATSVSIPSGGLGASGNSGGACCAETTDQLRFAGFNSAVPGAIATPATTANQIIINQQLP